jgi:LPXTG-motif cell wall-anchored protein
MGVTTYTCVCGETKTEAIETLPEHGPCVYAQYNATNHTKICACGNVSSEAHRWDEGKLIVVPTATREGTYAISCQDCGYVRYETATETDAGATDDDNQDDDYSFKQLLGCKATVSGGFGGMLLLVGIAGLLTRKKKEN